MDSKLLISEKLLQSYEKMICIYKGQTKPAQKPLTARKSVKPLSHISKYSKMTALERAQSAARKYSYKKPVKKALPPLELTKYLKQTDPNTIKRIYNAFGTIKPDIILKLMLSRRNNKLKLKRCVQLATKIESMYEKRIEILKTIHTPVGQKKEYLRKIKIRLLETKIEKNDATQNKNLIIEKINNIYKKLTDNPLKSNIIENIQWIVDEVTKSYSQLSARKTISSPIKDQVQPGVIPPLLLSTPYVPLSRMTRRAFSGAATLSTMRKEDPYDVHELDILANQLGQSMVSRFSTMIMKFDRPVFLEREKEADVPPPTDIIEKACGGWIGEIMQTLFDEYLNFEEFLPLSLFSDYEIQQLEQSSMDFVSMRDNLISAAAEAFSDDEIINFLAERKNVNLTPTLYIARDLILYSNLCDFVPQLLDVFEPTFRQTSSKIEDDYILYIGWVIFFEACLEACDLSTKERILEIISAHFELDTAPIMNTRNSKAKVLALLQLGVFVPERMLSALELFNQPQSLLMRFISDMNLIPTVVEAASNFLAAAFKFADDDIVLYHLATFNTIACREFARPRIRENILGPIIKAIRKIVEGRNPQILAQMRHLFLLPNCLRHIELEAFPMGTNPKPKKAVVKQEDISYLDIPALDLSNSVPALSLDNPKLQLHFQQKVEEEDRNEDDMEDVYLEKRQNMPIYASDIVHVHLIELIFSIIIDPGLHKLDVRFVDQFPHVNRKPNVLFTLMRHMESNFNAGIVDELSEEFKAPPSIDKSVIQTPPRTFTRTDNIFSIEEESPAGIVPIIDIGDLAQTIVVDKDDIVKEREMLIERKDDYRRMQRLTMPELFKPKKYSNGKFIASGAFGMVMAVTSPKDPGKNLAVKILKKSQGSYDNPHLYEVFTEVTILDLCRGDRRATQIVDFGCTSTSYYIVMEQYPSTLKAWRKNTENPSLSTMLRIYREFLRSTMVLLDHKINHFDIKCDNVMLDKDGYPALADFGESMTYVNENNSRTLLNKGTEWIKSPEMLSIALNSTVTEPSFDRRKKIGAGPASDVWSIGCLFYELLVGKFLFATTDWSYFYTRVTSSEVPLLEQNDIDVLKNLGCDRGPDFLEFVLQRSVRARPSLEQVIAKFDDMFPEAENGVLPTFAN